MKHDFKDKNKESLSLDRLYILENSKDLNQEKLNLEYSFNGYIGNIIPRAYFTPVSNPLQGDCLLTQEETSQLIRSIGSIKIAGNLIDRFYDDCTVVLSQRLPMCTEQKLESCFDCTRKEKSC